MYTALWIDGKANDRCDVTVSRISHGMALVGLRKVGGLTARQGTPRRDGTYESESDRFSSYWTTRSFVSCREKREEGRGGNGHDTVKCGWVDF
jgi:hypothetical protein